MLRPGVPASTGASAAPLSARWLRLRPWVITTAGVLVAAAVRLLLAPLVGDNWPLLIFTFPVALAAVVGGLGPALFATALSAAVGTLLFGSTIDLFPVRMGTFVALGALIAAVGYQLRRGEDRVRAAAASAEASEARFRGIFEAAAIGLAEVDLSGRFVRVNDRLCDILGYTREDLLGRPFTDITHPDDVAADLAQARRLASGELSSYRIEKRYIRGDGSIVWTRLAGSAIRGRSEAACFIAAIEDISEQRALTADRDLLLAQEQQLRQEAEAINRSKDEFLATLSHELRTPINAVLGWAQMLSRGEVRPERRAHALDIILRNAEAENRLVQDLLDLSGLMMGRLDVGMTSLDATQLACQVVESLQPEATRRGVRLECRPSAGAVAIQGDAVRLQQVIWNVVSNALKFSDTGAPVEVLVCAAGGHAEISVVDQGPGIEPGFAPYVFDRFRQGNSSPTRSTGGLGIGLAIAREIVSRHHGTITIGPNQPTGCVVTVRIPAARSTAAA